MSKINIYLHIIKKIYLPPCSCTIKLQLFPTVYHTLIPLLKNIWHNFPLQKPSHRKWRFPRGHWTTIMSRNKGLQKQLLTKYFQLKCFRSSGGPSWQMSMSGTRSTLRPTMCTYNKTNKTNERQALLSLSCVLLWHVNFIICSFYRV